MLWTLLCKSQVAVVILPMLTLGRTLKAAAMAHLDLPGFNQDIAQLEFDGFLDWFVKYTDPQVLWRAQPTYILVQLSFLFGALATLIHAIWNGGRLPYLWIGTVLHGIVVEIITYNLDDIDNFWHSQTPITFLGRRLPLHIILLYPVFLYNASIAVSKMRLPNWAEPFAVGLVVVLIDIPYDIVSVKFLHWTWHDTDPNIGDRHYWVPWNSYYFHATFAASFTFFFHGFRRWFCHVKGAAADKWQSGSVCCETLFTVLPAMLGMPGGVLLFLPLYHPLHDLAGIHSEVSLFILFTIFLMVVWSADRNPVMGSRPHKGQTSARGTCLLCFQLVIHYSVFMYMVLFRNPQEEVSIGIHERIGPCGEMADIQTAFGTVLKKRRYLCVTDYNEDYFDFKCLPGGRLPANGSSWYTACGTPFENRVEYIAIVCTICFAAATVFYNLHFRSGKVSVVARDTTKAKPKPKTKKQ